MLIVGLPRCPEVLCNKVCTAVGVVHRVQMWCTDWQICDMGEGSPTEHLHHLAQLTMWPFPPHLHPLRLCEHKPGICVLDRAVHAARKGPVQHLSLTCTVPWTLLPASKALQCSFGSAFLNTFSMQQIEFLLLNYFPPIFFFSSKSKSSYGDLRT